MFLSDNILNSFFVRIFTSGINMSLGEVALECQTSIYINKSKPSAQFSAKWIKALRALGWARSAALVEAEDTDFRRS